MQPSSKIKEEIVQAQLNPNGSPAGGSVASVVYTPLKNKPLNPLKMRKHICEQLRTHQYDKLQQEIIKYNLDTKDLAEFFYKEGSPILYSPVAFAVDNRALMFLYKNIPIGALKKALSNDDFSMLKAFLRAESGLEKSVAIDISKRRTRIERFSLLLKIDAEGVSNFMKESGDKPYITEKIKQDFITAQQNQISISNTQSQQK